MTDRTFLLGALTWSVAILVAAYLYRVLITDPHYLTSQQLPSVANQAVTVRP